MWRLPDFDTAVSIAVVAVAVAIPVTAVVVVLVVADLLLGMDIEAVHGNSVVDACVMNRLRELEKAGQLPLDLDEGHGRIFDQLRRLCEEHQGPLPAEQPKEKPPGQP